MSSSGNRFRQVLLNLFLAASAVTATSAILASCSGGPQDSSGGSLDTPRVEAIAAQGWELIKMNSYNYADTQLDSFGHFTTTPNGCHQDAEGAVDVALWNQIAPLVNKALSKPLLATDSEACFPRPDGSKLFGTVDIIVDPPTPQSRRALEEADTEADSAAAAEPAPLPWPSWLPNPFSTSTPEPTPTVTVTVTPTPHPRPTPTSTSTSNPFPTPTSSSHPGPTPSWSASASPTPSPSPSGITKTLFENNGDQICTTIQDTAIAQQLVQQLDQVASLAYKEDCPQAQ